MKVHCNYGDQPKIQTEFKSTKSSYIDMFDKSMTHSSIHVSKLNNQCHNPQFKIPRTINQVSKAIQVETTENEICESRSKNRPIAQLAFSKNKLSSPKLETPCQSKNNSAKKFQLLHFQKDISELSPIMMEDPNISFSNFKDLSLTPSLSTETKKFKQQNLLKEIEELRISNKNLQKALKNNNQKRFYKKFGISIVLIVFLVLLSLHFMPPNIRNYINSTLQNPKLKIENTEIMKKNEIIQSQKNQMKLLYEEKEQLKQSLFQIYEKYDELSKIVLTIHKKSKEKISQHLQSNEFIHTLSLSNQINSTLFIH